MAVDGVVAEGAMTRSRRRNESVDRLLLGVQRLRVFGLFRMFRKVVWVKLQLGDRGRGSLTIRTSILGTLDIPGKC